MDIQLFDKIFNNITSEKISTEHCLTEYYKAKGFNVFKSAEYAQNNILNFVEFANSNILEAKKSNISSLFSSVTKDIVEIDTRYYIIKGIYKKMLVIGWRDFEFISSAILECCFGAFDVKTTQGTNDGGVDFEGKLPVYSCASENVYGVIEVYGQSKKYTGNVGIYDVKSFVAYANSKKRNYVHHAQLFMFFTTSDFAKSSIKELEVNGFIGLSGFQLATLMYNHKSILKAKSDLMKEIID